LTRGLFIWCTCRFRVAKNVYCLFRIFALALGVFTFVKSACRCGHSV
jgi:hypothetical protein